MTSPSEQPPAAPSAEVEAEARRLMGLVVAGKLRVVPPTLDITPIAMRTDAPS
jgi:hypothetical protein